VQTIQHRRPAFPETSENGRRIIIRDRTVRSLQQAELIHNVLVKQWMCFDQTTPQNRSSADFDSGQYHSQSLTAWAARQAQKRTMLVDMYPSFWVAFAPRFWPLQGDSFVKCDAALKRRIAVEQKTGQLCPVGVATLPSAFGKSKEFSLALSFHSLQSPNALGCVTKDLSNANP